MTNLIPLVVVHQEPRVDSRVIASQLGVEHQNTRELIQQYQTDLEEFGLLRFETEAVKNEGARGTKYQKYVLLNEDQSYLVLTYTQNTPQARDLKKRLIRSFSEHRRAASDPLSDFGPKAQFAVLEMLVNKVAQEIAGGFIDYLRIQPGRFTPESTPRASYPRHPAPVDLWEPQVAAFVSDRQQVTTTLVLDYLGIPAAEQTQYPKNRIARILKNIGFACCIVKVGRKAQRVWMRTYHA